MTWVYITVIIITMLNVAGISFVVFIMFFSKSTSNLKKANLNKSNGISASSSNVIERNKVSVNQTQNFSASLGKKIGAAGSSVAESQKGAIRVGVGKKEGLIDKSTNIISSVTSASITKSTENNLLNNNENKKNSTFDNIDDILNDLDLSDFDDLDPDDFT